MTLRYIPDQMFFVTDAFEVVHDTVARVVTHPVGHSVPAIRQDMAAVVITSSRGLTRVMGTANAYIDSTLRMIIDCDDRNELVKHWELAQ